MSETQHDSDHRRCGEEVAAYALGALDPAEARVFLTHLETCTVCRDELAAFQHVVDALPMSAARYPAPKRLRRRVLRAIEDEPKLEIGAQRQGARSQRHGRGALQKWLSLPRPALGLAAAAAVAVVVVVVAIGGVTSNGSGTSGTRVYAAQVTGSSGTAQLNVTSGHAELIVHRFPAPPAGHIYEVWVQRRNQPPSPTSALFSVTAKGDGDVDVPGSLRGVQLVLVTPEPAGGSLVPTHAPVISARLT